SHHLVLARVHAEPEISRDGAVEQAQRMGKTDFLEQAQVGTAAFSISGGGPFSDTVHGQYSGPLKAGDEERAGCVRQVMLEIFDGPLVSEHFADFALRTQAIEPGKIVARRIA